MLWFCSMFCCKNARQKNDPRRVKHHFLKIRHLHCDPYKQKYQIDCSLIKICSKLFELFIHYQTDTDKNTTSMTHDCFPSPDPSVSNVQVIRLTLLCDEAPAPIVLDLTGIISLSPLFLSVPPSRSLLRGRVQPCPRLRHLAPLRCNSCAQKDCNGCVHA